jgi:AmmeMemoRadiSam system protein B/AmmeMemoRadiSam system protein A
LSSAASLEAAVSSPSVVCRPAAVAGQFYPAAPDVLERTVLELLQSERRDRAPLPKVLVVPHAGYVYSGSTAARCYASIASEARRITRVVLIGPAHRVVLRGVAIPTVDAFETPLGRVPLDRASLARLANSPHVVASDHAHAAEHSLEVQLPFLQCVLDRFWVVPMVVGDASPESVAELLETVWGGDETLIVVSSDLSHYLPYESARRVDAASLAQVLAFGPDLDHEQACGATAINAVVRVARRLRLTPQLLGACNSGDTAGTRDRVVGYAALAFAQAAADRRGATLLALARRAVEDLFRAEAQAGGAPDAPFLEQPGATFVTLRQRGELRGCIGSLDAERPLREDVIANARAAATRDPRFEPVTVQELDELTIEVSLLSARQALDFANEEHLLEQLTTLRAGVTLEYAQRRATFLPQVWNDIGDARDFLRLLKAKAGLAPDFWSDDIRVSHYAVEKWSES